MTERSLRLVGLAAPTPQRANPFFEILRFTLYVVSHERRLWPEKMVRLIKRETTILVVGAVCNRDGLDLRQAAIVDTIHSHTPLTKA